MAEVFTKVNVQNSAINVNQGDILKNVEYIEYVKEDDTIIEVSNIVFPNIIVLTQSCDLFQDAVAREKNKNGEIDNQDKYLISAIVAPLYNFEDFRTGAHLSQLGLKMQDMGKRTKSKCGNIIRNEDKRYHYLKFESNISLTESVIDFKHYFTCNVNYLNTLISENYVCSVDTLYRELISQRFSNFLSRIGLPDPE